MLDHGLSRPNERAGVTEAASIQYIPGGVLLAPKHKRPQRGIGVTPRPPTLGGFCSRLVVWGLDREHRFDVLRRQQFQAVSSNFAVRKFLTGMALLGIAGPGPGQASRSPGLSTRPMMHG